LEIFVDELDAISCLQSHNPKMWRIEIFEKTVHGKFVPNYTAIRHTESEMYGENSIKEYTARK